MGSVMDCKLNPCCGDRLSCFGKPKPKQFNQAKKPEFVDGCAKARAAVERLANVQMNISLAEWSELSASILAALPAPSALENGPAGLADATPKPPDPSLSSLRKGAEVAVKPLVWNEYETEGEVDRWDAETALGSFYEISTEFDGYSVSNDHVHSDQRFDTPDEAKAFAQSDYETRIRSALVSGSREDGA